MEGGGKTCPWAWWPPGVAERVGGRRASLAEHRGKASESVAEKDVMSVGAPSKQDTALGRSLVDLGFVTRQELDDSIAVMQSSEEGQKSLGDVLVENGFVTRSQLDRVRTQIEDQGGLQQIPGYIIQSKLGAGAMATVYKARQISLDRTVAIKVLPKRMSSNKEFVERFYKEGKAAAKLNHPNIVGAVDVGEANGFHYFVMEFVEGQTVYDRLDRGEVYDEREALQIIIQVCKALVHAHAQGFIHRDVKPKNIMITSSGVAKLADMGLARGTLDKEAAMAEAGKAYGTPYYISPEQIRGELDIDARADLYSLGATFYHMVTGRVPFDAPTPSAVMHKHLKEDLVPPDHLNPSLSSGLGEIIEVAMAKKRRNRYASAEDMLTDLERVYRGEPPLVARKAYNLDTLAALEPNAGSGEQPQQLPPAVPADVAEQHTIDIAERTLVHRLQDPIVMGLGLLLVMAALVIMLLAWK